MLGAVFSPDDLSNIITVIRRGKKTQERKEIPECAGIVMRLVCDSSLLSFTWSVVNRNTRTQILMVWYFSYCTLHRKNTKSIIIWCYKWQKTIWHFSSWISRLFSCHCKSPRIYYAWLSLLNTFHRGMYCKRGKIDKNKNSLECRKQIHFLFGRRWQVILKQLLVLITHTALWLRKGLPCRLEEELHIARLISWALKLCWVREGKPEPRGPAPCSPCIAPSEPWEHSVCR